MAAFFYSCSNEEFDSGLEYSNRSKTSLYPSSRKKPNHTNIVVKQSIQLNNQTNTYNLQETIN